jgi:queuine tRNA-ribosyltransferase subunit QTRTD1
MVENDYYTEAIQKLRPDIVVGMADVLFGHKPGKKRTEIMGDRTLAWVKGLIAGMEDDEEGTPRTALFAPILPIEAEQQSYYLDALKDDLKESLAGLVLYDEASADAIPKGLRHLPRLFLGETNSPHKLLDAVALGIDIFAIPFIIEATEAGIALDFSFPAKNYADTPLPLGVDMWSSSHATNLSPLRKDCDCYACANHPRAFVQHLLNAKEMLGWVLLQLHNHHIIDGFFAGIRSGIRNGSFDDDREAFEKSYTAELPAKTGQGPRYD